jgi:hypothetical protein
MSNFTFMSFTRDGRTVNPNHSAWPPSDGLLSRAKHFIQTIDTFASKFLRNFAPMRQAGCNQIVGASQFMTATVVGVYNGRFRQSPALPCIFLERAAFG